MNRTDRLYAISAALRTAGPQGRTAAWLAERYEVSTRTIKRDMAALLEIGLPVAAQEGRGGGYLLVQQAALPPVAFSAAEAAAVAVVLAAEPQVPFAADGASALDKVLGAMNPTQRHQATMTARRIWMRESPLGSRAPSARVLDEALRTQVVVLLDYVDAQGQITYKRSVEPMAFIRTAHHWQLLAWCQMRGAGRWFRLDRVLRATLTRHKCSDRDLAEVFGEPPSDAQPVILPLASTQG